MKYLSWIKFKEMILIVLSYNSSSISASSQLEKYGNINKARVI